MKGYRQIRKFLALSLTLVLTAGCCTPVWAGEASDKKISKEETVYVMAGDNGAADKIIVSEWLKNLGKKSLIKDHTELQKIENVKGEETFTDGSWNAQGKDIYYQGEINKELPVEMKISYYLDGKKVSAKEIAGKSGKVKIRFDYTNNQKMDGVYVPFVLLTSMSLDNETFTDVEVVNGKAINDGQKSMVVGYALPGLEKSLNLSNTDINIPDYVEVTCKAEKFALDGTMTVATSSLLADLDIGNINSIDDLNGAMDDLQSAAQQLQDGSVKLQSGADELSKGTGDLYQGTKTLREKVTQLAAGLQSASAGAAQLQNGAGQLQAGAGKLETGAESLQGGIGQVAAGVESAVGGLSQTIAGDKQVLAGLSQLQASASQMGLNEQQQAALNQAVEQLKAGLSQTIAGQEAVSSGLAGGKDGLSQLQSGAGSLVSGSKELNAGLASLSGGAKDLNAGIAAACKGAGLLEQGAESLAQGAGKVNGGAGSLASGARDLSSGISQFKSQGIDELVQVFDGDISKVKDRLKALQNAAEDYQSFAGKKAETKGSVKFIYKTDEV